MRVILLSLISLFALTAEAAAQFKIERPVFVIVQAAPRCVCGPGCDCFQCPKDCAPRAAAPAALAPVVPPVYYRPVVQAPPPIFQSFRGGGC